MRMPKIMGTSLEQHRKEVRARLFDALADLLKKQTLESISIAQIASAAGVGRTAIYNHFPDKESMVVGFATSETNRFLESLSQAVSSEGSATDRLRTYIRHHIASRESYHLDLGHQLRNSLSPAALVDMRTHIVAVQETVAAIVQAGIDSGEFAQADVTGTISLINSCLQTQRIDAEAVEAFIIRAVTNCA